MTLAMAAIRLSRSVREIALDAIGGRRPPFAIDARCELACACGIDQIGSSAKPARSRPASPAQHARSRRMPHGGRV